MDPLIYVAVLCLGFVIAFATYELMGDPPHEAGDTGLSEAHDQKPN